VLVPLFSIASGGMAEVHLVLRDDGHFRRLFAQKRLHPHLHGDEVLRKMFLDEARVAGLLRHPHVVSVLDVGEDELGPFLLMPFVSGLSLAAFQEGLQTRAVRLPVALAVTIARQVADALAAAHGLCGHDGTLLHLVHRDVSPQKRRR
jgi:serine/threonine protein kinase